MYTPFLGKKPPEADKIPLAPRPSTLKGKTVALYHNDKRCSMISLRVVGDLLKEKIGANTFEVHTRVSYASHPERAIDEAAKADAVVLGTAD